MIQKATVITLVSGRQNALENLIHGLNLGIEKPDELIVVFMNETPYKLPYTNFPIKSLSLKSDNKIALASARNLGAKNATFDKFIFLDVDCIPEKDLVLKYKTLTGKTIQSGAVRYLPKTAMYNLNFEQLDSLSLPDRIRVDLVDLPYELFWSLNFACSREVFDKVGGFNEAFKGYGGEDTDFAFRTREKEIRIENLNITAYHQYHDSYQPPLNHIDTIIENAKIFKTIWHKWPMEGWLKQFEALGLIDWGNEITILRYPTAEEINSALK